MKRKSEQLFRKIEPADIRAIQDLEQGKADESQQIRALKFIIEVLCGTYMPTYGETDRDSNYLDGRRFVGLELVNCLKLNAKALSERGEKNE